MMLSDVKAYLRIATGDEDVVLQAMIDAATALCEAFVGQWLVARDTVEIVPASGAWRRLAARPVVAIGAVARMDDGGNAVGLASDAYAIDIDADGDGWVRVTKPVGGAEDGRLRIAYRAGLAVEMAGVPAPIRQGIVRMAADSYARRDGGDPDPPAAVAALWRPYRRMRLA